MPTQKEKPVAASEAKSLFADLKAFPALVLAVSGGPDSTALLLLAARWRDALKRPPKLIAVTVDHGLRKEAKAEAAAVAKLARKLKVAHRTVRWRGRKPASGLQQAARAARYRLLGEAARAAGAAHILTAHTLDDQAETVLIRMSRGSGITGLGAMQRVTSLPALMRAPSPHSPSKTGVNALLPGEGWGGGYAAKELPPSRRASRFHLPLKGGGESANAATLVLVRPLLDVPKARLMATLQAAGIPFADDPSNRDPRFTRARLRGLMPQLAEEGLDARRLATLARRLRRADAAIEAMVREAKDFLTVDPPTPHMLTIEVGGFFILPDEISLRVLGRAIAEVGDEGPVELAKLEALKAGLDTAPKAGARPFRRTLAGAIVTLADLRLTVERAPPRRRKALTKRPGGRAKDSKSR